MSLYLKPPSLAVQEEVLRSEVSRLRSRLSQQERLLSGAVKRLRSTNQLKEGMEKVLIDQRRSPPHLMRLIRGSTHYKLSLFPHIKWPEIYLLAKSNLSDSHSARLHAVIIL